MKTTTLATIMSAVYAMKRLSVGLTQDVNVLFAQLVPTINVAGISAQRYWYGITAFWVSLCFNQQCLSMCGLMARSSA